VVELLKETREAAERSKGRGIMSHGDLLNVLQLLKHLRDELYRGYTEEVKEPEMWENLENWEDIGIIDYNKVFDEFEEKIAREKEQAIREKGQTARKLKAMGVSDEILAAAGLEIPR
jgi:hypothetical protein